MTTKIAQKIHSLFQQIKKIQKLLQIQILQKCHCLQKEIKYNYKLKKIKLMQTIKSN